MVKSVRLPGDITKHLNWLALGSEYRAASFVHSALVRLASCALMVETAQVSLVVLNKYICFGVARIEKESVCAQNGNRLVIHPAPKISLTGVNVVRLGPAVFPWTFAPHRVCDSCVIELASITVFTKVAT